MPLAVVCEYLFASCGKYSAHMLIVNEIRISNYGMSLTSKQQSIFHIIQH